MLQLIKIDPTNYFQMGLLYQFRCEVGNWKSGYLTECLLRGIKPLTQGSLSDFNFFKAIHAQKSPGDLPNTEYILCDKGTPVTLINAIYGSGRVDLTVSTLPKYQRKGYATAAIHMAEKDIFSDLNNLFTTITDITTEKISSRIAVKLGYVFYDKTGIYIKGNLNINFEEELNKPKQKRKN